MSDEREDEKAVLVAGSNGVLGIALCRQFLDTGATVFGCSRRPPELRHERFRHWEFDLSSEQGVLSLMERMDAAEARADVLILNMAVSSSALIAELRESSLLETLCHNLVGPAVLIRENARRMLPRRYGRIVAVSSIRVAELATGAGAYSISKAAEEQLIRQTALEFGKYGVTANVVRISVMESGLARELPERARAQILDRCAIKRVCTPEDVCNAVRFFASAGSSYLTGQTLNLGFI